LEGPALKIFERKLGPIEQMPLDDALRQSDGLLCGTSWQSDIEWRAIELARSRGKPSAAFLDHWVNYRELSRTLRARWRNAFAGRNLGR
jgi:hypothetical protein